jgi:MFS transporter, SP family, solute carrier family 2 (facilitated glucose transporter), member 1
VILVQNQKCETSFYCGLYLGINAGVPPTYLTEIAPINLRGAFGSAHQLFTVIAIWVSQIFGLPSILGSTSRWPILLGLALVPSLFQLITLPFCPDSPQFLIFGKQDDKKARKGMAH